jgi:hypothetical protein
MSTDETNYSLNRQLSDDCQAPQLKELHKSTDNRSNEISVGEPGGAGYAMHDESCCCQDCWSAKFD